MTAELAIRTGLPGELRANAYILPPDLTLTEWSSVVRLAEHIAEASPWWLADAMAYGEDRFAEDHSQALPTAEQDPHGVSQARMKQAAWMGHKYPPVTRVPGASYTHHRIVADMLPGDRAYLLSKTVQEQWSTRALIEQVNVIQEDRRGRELPAVTDDPAPLPLSSIDLTDAARQAMSSRGAGVGRKHQAGFERGFVEALLWREDREAFTRWIDE